VYYLVVVTFGKLKGASGSDASPGNTTRPSPL
jgi:hypothetical protein